MEYEKIKQLMNDMGNSKLTSIDIDFPDGTKISMKKESTKEIQVIQKSEQLNENEKQIEVTEKEELRKSSIPILIRWLFRKLMGVVCRYS